MDFLDRLRDLSKKKGIMNNMQLSKASGVPYTTLDSFYRIGYDNAKLSTLRKLADTLDCTLDDLVYGDAATSEADWATKTEMRKLVKPYRRLKDKEKALVDYVLAYASSRETADEKQNWD